MELLWDIWIYLIYIWYIYQSYLKHNTWSECGKFAYINPKYVDISQAKLSTLGFVGLFCEYISVYLYMLYVCIFTCVWSYILVYGHVFAYVFMSVWLPKFSVWDNWIDFPFI